MTESAALNNLTIGCLVPAKDAGRRSGGLRNVDHDRNFQGRTAARAFLAGCDARILALEVELGGHSVSAHGAMGHPLRAILLKGLHFHLLLTYSDASKGPNVFEIFVKISKPRRIAGRGAG